MPLKLAYFDSISVEKELRPSLKTSARWFQSRESRALLGSLVTTGVARKLSSPLWTIHYDTTL